MGAIIGCWKVFDGSEDVGSTNTVSKGLGTTNMIPIMAGSVFSIFVIATSSGTVTLAVECITHYSDTIASAVEPEGMADIIALSDETLHHVGFAPPVTQWLALKVTGSGSNHSSTVVTIYLLVQESVG